MELVENTDRVVYSFSADWDELLFVSSAYEHVWGRSIAALQNNPTDFLNGVHPDDRDQVRNAMERASEGEQLDVEFRINANGGVPQWLRAHIEPIVDETGTVKRIAGFTADITEDRRRQERHKRQRETLVTLATDDAVTTGDFETAVQRITETAAEVLDVARVNVWLVEDDTGEEILTCADHYDRPTGNHDQGLELVTEDYPSYLEALETHQAINADDARNDPRTAELLDYLEDNDIGALLDGTLRSEGEVIGVVCHEHVGGTREWTDDEIDFASDVADIVHRALRNQKRKEREQELERYRKYTDRVFNAIDDLFFVFDESGEITQWNDSVTTITGYTDTEIESMNSLDFVTEDDTEQVVAAIERVFETGHAQVQASLVTKDGTTIPHEFVADRVQHPDGTMRLVGIGRDISARLEREQELQQKNDRLEEFTSVVSHDLRNPLSVAEGRLRLAKADCDSEHLDEIAGALDRIDALISDLLKLAHEGENTVEKDILDLADLTQSCWKTVETADATLSTDIDREIRADRSRLRQLFENCYRNAVEHGGKDVTITVGHLDDGFYIEDDGPGIPKDNRKEVFGAGYSTNQNGTGFGLSIVQQVVEAHNWEIRITDGSNGGARFEITGIESVSE